MTPKTDKPRLFLVANRLKPEAEPLFHEMRAWLADRAEIVGAALDPDLNGLADTPDVDFVIVLGGDGSILHAGRALGDKQIPLVGVNLGKLGYLADFDPDEFRATFDAITCDCDSISERMMFRVRVRAAGQPEYKDIALNDCVLRVGEPYRTLSLALELNGAPLCKLHGDGVIVATPTGSTAHNMSCGGPLVEPDVDAMILTPRCPHSFTHRPIVLAGSSTLTITLIGDHQPAAAVMDGQSIRRLQKGDSVEIARHQSRFQLVRHPDRQPWETLITKLKWGLDIR